MKINIVFVVFSLIVIPGTVPALANPPSTPESLPDPSKVPIISQPPIVSRESTRKWNEAERLAELGRGWLRQKDWQKAQEFFRQSLAVWEDNPEVWYGLSQCHAGQGDKTKALETYRKTVYSRAEDAAWNTDYPYQENRVDRLMQFALMLEEAKQIDEAVAVYNRAVGLLNYHDGKPDLKVLLPEFGRNAGQELYRPVLFQAMAHTAIGLKISDESLAVDHLGEAVRLSPGSGVAHFYRAQMLRRAGGKPEEAKAEYLKARELAPKATGKAVDWMMNETELRHVKP